MEDSGVLSVDVLEEIFDYLLFARSRWGVYPITAVF